MVGPKAALAVRGARLSAVNWLGEEQHRGLTVKVRSMAKPASASFDGEAIRFDQAEYGVAPGQAAVLYEGTRLLGGGWIAETVAAHESCVDAAAA